MYKNLLIFGFLAFTLAVFAEPQIPNFVRNKVGLAEPNYQTPFYRRMVTYQNRMIEQTAQQSNTLAFVGDSIVQSWNTAPLLATLDPRPSTINLGIGSDTIDGLILRITANYTSTIRNWYLAIGVNDAGRGARIDEIPRQIERLRSIFETSDTLYWQAVLPTSDQLSDTAEEYRVALNLAIQDTCNQMDNCTFVPAPQVFAENVATMTSDGVHPNATGYAVLNAAAIHAISGWEP